MIKLLAAGLLLALAAVLIAAAHMGVVVNTTGTSQPGATIPVDREGAMGVVVNTTGTSLCSGEAMLVMSPEYDRGCAYAPAARYLGNSGWFVLDEYPEYFASSIEFEYTDNFDQYENWRPDSHIKDGLKIDLRMPELPLVGQSADVILDVVSPHTASPVNAAFRIQFVGDVKILSLYPPLQPNEFMSDNLPGRDFYTPRAEIHPGETRQFIVTIMPLSETPLQVWADGYDEHGYYVTQSGDMIRVSIGSQTSGHQLDGDSYTRDPDIEYVWTEILHPQCWTTPWDRNGQTVHDYADRGIEIHDTMHLPIPAPCLLCDCIGGSIMFLTPEHDRADVLSIDFWNP